MTKFAEELKSKYLKHNFRFDDCIGFMKEKMEEIVSSAAFDDNGFTVHLSNIREPRITTSHACNCVYTFELPYGQYDENDFHQWFKDNGFTMCEVNYQRGYRIR